MKRLLLRVVALGIVVVLGVVAIAQVQRGAERKSAADEPSATGASQSGGPSSPLLAPAGPGPNPLRVEPEPAAGPPDSPSDGPSIGSAIGAGAGPLSGLPTGRIPPATLPPDVEARALAEGGTPPSPVAGAPQGDPFMRTAAGQGLAMAGGAGVAGAAAAADDGTAAAGDGPSSVPENLGAPPGGQTPSDFQIPPYRSSDADSRYSAAGDPTASGPAVLSPGNLALPAEPGGAQPLAGADQPGTLGGRQAITGTGIEPYASTEAGSAAAEPGRLTPDPSAPLSPPGAAAGSEGTGRPGGKHLEGPQSAQLTIQKTAPAEVQVGKPATFTISVRNSGTVAAGNVEVRDQVPKGTRLIDTEPRASVGVHGELVWTLGTVQPGEETSIQIHLMPTEEGEIGSVATVQICTDASAHCVATRPQLAVQTSAAGQVLIGEELTLSITVTNPGSGVATGVVLEEHIPSALQHPAGTALEYEVGDLKPGESRKLELSLLAARPGPATNLLVARADAGLRTEDRLNVEVLAPKLDVAVDGPRRRYLEREAVYQVSVANPGTAPAEQVELVAYLPQGLKFVSANNAGYYEESDRTVRWRLEELPISEKGTVELVTMPVEAGEQTIKVRSVADKGVEAEAEQPVVIEGIAAILFQAADVVDPIEVGGETTYEIRVVNQGSKAATNVQLAVSFPPEMRPVAAEGPTRWSIDGSRVLFEGLTRLAPKADTTYRVRAQGVRPGDVRVHVQLMTAEMQTPVSKEESTRVYSDE